MSRKRAQRERDQPAVPGRRRVDGHPLITVATVFLVLGVVWGAVALGSQLGGVNEGQTSDPFEGRKTRRSMFEGSLLDPR